MADIEFDDLVKELKWFSEAVSKGVRATAFGTIAALWAVLSADGVTLLDTALGGMPTSRLVSFAFIFASAALLVDMLQNIAALWMTNIGIDMWESREKVGETVTFGYDRENLGRFGLFLYWANYSLYPLKLLRGLFLVATIFSVSGTRR